MSIFTLLLTIILAFLLSEFADAFPQILWGWVHLPKWLLGLGILGLVAWCMDDESSP